MLSLKRHEVSFCLEDLCPYFSPLASLKICFICMYKSGQPAALWRDSVLFICLQVLKIAQGNLIKRSQVLYLIPDYHAKNYFHRF